MTDSKLLRCPGKKLNARFFDADTDESGTVTESVFHTIISGIDPDMLEKERVGSLLCVGWEPREAVDYQQWLAALGRYRNFRGAARRVLRAMGNRDALYGTKLNEVPTHTHALYRERSPRIRHFSLTSPHPLPELPASLPPALPPSLPPPGEGFVPCFGS